MTAPAVAVVMVTLCADAKVPGGGVNSGAATKEVAPGGGRKPSSTDGDASPPQPTVLARATSAATASSHIFHELFLKPNRNHIIVFVLPLSPVFGPRVDSRHKNRREVEKGETPARD